MRYATAVLIVLGLGIATVHQSGMALAQATTGGQPPAAAPSTAPAAAPAAPANPVTTVPTLKAKDLEGLNAFGSDGQQVGKVAKVNVLPDGNVKDAEIHSFGFFSTAYIVPADKLSVKGGRVAISMTSEEVKKLTK